MVASFLNRLRLRILWSLAGLRDAWTSEHSFRSWVWANAVSALLAVVLPLTAGERMGVLALGLLVLAFELANTALERAVDLVTTEEHDLARRAKDAGSAAVAMAGIAAGVSWVVVLLRLAAPA